MIPFLFKIKNYYLENKVWIISGVGAILLLITVYYATSCWTAYKERKEQERIQHAKLELKKAIKTNASEIDTLKAKLSQIEKTNVLLENDTVAVISLPAFDRANQKYASKKGKKH